MHIPQSPVPLTQKVILGGKINLSGTLGKG